MKLTVFLFTKIDLFLYKYNVDVISLFSLSFGLFPALVLGIDLDGLNKGFVLDACYSSA